MITRREIVDYANDWLEINRFKDYSPNGLQVEGKAIVKNIISGVTANLALIEAAIAHDADLILVHHGYFWTNEDSRVIGMKQRRLKLLLEHDINLVAYHLPLDAHPLVGNNVQLANLLGFNVDGLTGSNDLIAYTTLTNCIDVSILAKKIELKLQRTPLVVGSKNKIIQKVAWCTGAAQNYLQSAIDIGADAYISGEISEQTTHIANEHDMVYVAAGHHATERYGVIALGNHLAKRFDITHQFIDIDNPV